jgi:hypothetical protein
MEWRILTCLLSAIPLLSIINYTHHTGSSHPLTPHPLAKLSSMLASALKAGRLCQVRNARGYASAAGKIGDKKVAMSPLEQDRFINYQVSSLLASGLRYILQEPSLTCFLPFHAAH